MSSPASSRPRLALLTNILVPYRLPILRHLAEQFDLTVLYSGRENHRPEWLGLERAVQGFQVKRTEGVVFRWTKRQAGSPLETRYLHLNHGLYGDLRRLRPEVIVSTEMGFRSLVALIYGWIASRPVWIWWGGTPHTERYVGTTKRLVRHGFARVVRHWLSYGVTSTEYLLSLGVARARIVELQNCVAESLYRQPVPRTFHLEPRPVILCVGRLVPGKGVNHLLQAAARLQREGLTFSLLIVGDGPARPGLEQLTTELRLKHVHFVGACTPDALPAVYRSADALVFPTLDDVWGLVVNEALWSGLPALVSAYAGCAKELVPATSTFDPLDDADFTAKLRSAVTGKLPPPDVTRLKTMDEVAERIARALWDTLPGSSQIAHGEGSA